MSYTDNFWVTEYQTQEKIILKKQKKRLSEESADVFPVSYPMSILHFIWEIQTPQPFPQQTWMQQEAWSSQGPEWSSAKVNSSLTVTALGRFRFYLAPGINHSKTIIFS